MIKIQQTEICIFFLQNQSFNLLRTAFQNPSHCQQKLVTQVRNIIKNLLKTQHQPQKYVMECRLLSEQNEITQEHQNNQHTVDSPMQIRLINFLGLKQYMMDKFIFKRRQPSYRIRKQHGKPKLFMPRQYKPPTRYHMQLGILQQGKHSIPYVRLIPRTKNNVYHDTIVYAHGNSSDMSDGLKFMERMSLIYEAEYLVFDYNGYGQSRRTEVGEEIISQDLQIVLAWLNKPLNQIILWGFSLGTYPVLHAAAKYFVKGVILQCPIGSVGCFFRQNLFTQIKFKQDYFANIDLISAVKGKIFMIHSAGDEIIPISHAQLLYNKFVAVKGANNIYFLQVMNLSHNGIHKYIVSQKSNDLQKQLLFFLENIKNDEQLGLKQVDLRFLAISQKIKQGKIQEETFEQNTYQLVQDSKGNLGSRVKQPEINCLCFSEQSPKLTRQKFKVK